jgi:hypothetical protein
MLIQNSSVLTSHADLRIIHTYLERSTVPRLPPRNLSDLAGMVKNKLGREDRNVEKTLGCREWLKEKGISLQPLLDEMAAKRKRQAEQKDKD